MNDRVKSLIESITTRAVEDVAFDRVRDCRFGIFFGAAFVWICLDRVSGEDRQDGDRKVDKLWSRTNEVDDMGGWANCEFSLATPYRTKSIVRIVAFLKGKVGDAERIDVKYATTPGRGYPGPMLVADSDNPDLRYAPDDVGC